MTHLSTLAPLTLVSILFAQASGESPIEKANTIPLDKIWAYEMPGTRDVRELEPDHFGKHVADLPGEQQLKLLHGSLVQQIIRSLIYLREEESVNAQSGFAVSGDVTGVRFIGAMIKAKGEEYVKQLRALDIKMHMISGGAKHWVAITLHRSKTPTWH